MEEPRNGNSTNFLEKSYFINLYNFSFKISISCVPTIQCLTNSTWFVQTGSTLTVNNLYRLGKKTFKKQILKYVLIFLRELLDNI